MALMAHYIYNEIFDHLSRKIGQHSFSYHLILFGAIQACSQITIILYLAYQIFNCYSL